MGTHSLKSAKTSSGHARLRALVQETDRRECGWIPEGLLKFLAFGQKQILGGCGTAAGVGFGYLILWR